MGMIGNSIKMDTLYRAVYSMIDWIVPIDETGVSQEKINNLRKKYKKMMLLMIGKIPEAYIDQNIHYIAPDDTPVIAALLIRVACDKDKRYSRFRAWLSGKYTEHPEKYYLEILEFNMEIEQMLDDLYEKKIYISELEDRLRETYPGIVLSLPLHTKNMWETIIKDSMHFNEAMLLKTIVPLIHDIEDSISFLPQLFDDGSFYEENYRKMKKNINFGENRTTLFASSLFETKPYMELIKMAKYQEKCRSLLIQLIRASAWKMYIHAAEKVQSMGNAKDYFAFIAGELDLSEEQTKEFIENHLRTQNMDSDNEDNQPVDFIIPGSLDSYRLYKMIESDATLKKIYDDALSNKRDTLLQLYELSNCPEKNEKVFSDAQEDESQTSE